MSRAAKKHPGRILFVGSGPGDPALLTVRAREVLGRATLAFTDPDVDKGVLALIGTAVEPGPDGEPAVDVRAGGGVAGRGGQQQVGPGRARGPGGGGVGGGPPHPP
ncbi:SAM-dependent methyltransferase, partial [Nocardia cyriacigeorgica]|uniref:SAM-dependent methyltransferase n=1 Tax=Nocardia cyriacigeorgica TaxID=135487 RepID=UPI0024558DCB